MVSAPIIARLTSARIVVMIKAIEQVCFRTGVLAGLVSAAWVAFAVPVEGQPSARPQYTPEGQLSLPVGFETWVFVGSNLGLAYKRELPVTTATEAARGERQLFHNIYINPESYAHFAATKQFPDPTVLVMEVFAASDKEPMGVLAAGVYNGDRVGLEVAVKDTRRPVPLPSPWAYYTFMDPNGPPIMRDPTPPEDDGFCQACHKLHASLDNVWVQFYPTLRKLTQ
jgi:hypothetical protein